MNDDEITALLDHAIGPGPTGPDLDVVLRAGERAAQRRRATVAALAAVVVIVGAGAVAATGAGGSRADQAPVVQPTPTEPGPPLTTETTGLDDFLETGDLAELRPGGLLRLRPGVEVVRWVDNPMDLDPPAYSMALWLRYQRVETWHLLDSDGDGGGRVLAGAQSDYGPVGPPGSPTFDQWLASEVERRVGLELRGDPLMGPDGSLIDIRPDGSLDLAPGVELRRRIDGPGPAISVAIVHDGRELWVTFEPNAGETDYRDGASAFFDYADEFDMTFEQFAAGKSQ